MAALKWSRKRLLLMRLTVLLLACGLTITAAEIAFRVHRYRQLLEQCREHVVVARPGQPGLVLKPPWLGSEALDEFLLQFHQAAVYDAGIGYRMLPNREFEYTAKDLAPRKWRTNSHGHIADDDYPAAKPAGEYRIATIGDSFTQGHSNGVRWQSLLQARLNEDAAWRQFVQGKFTRVLNLGLAGIGVGQFRAVYELEALRFEPDMVLLNFITNDIGRRHFSLGQIKTHADAEDHIHKNILDRLPWFRIYPELLASTDFGRLLGLKSRLDPEMSRYYFSDDEALGVCVAALSAIVRQCPNVLLLHHPTCEELETGRLDSADVRILGKLEAGLGGPRIHYMAPHLSRLNEAGMPVSRWYQLPQDSHMSDAGQAVYAAAMAQLLCQRYAGKRAD